MNESQVQGGAAGDHPARRGWHKSRSLPIVLACSFYFLFALAVTWPIASAPARISASNADLFSHAWGIAWVVHQATHDPLHLFDANIYWPYTMSLAHGESLLTQSAMAAPILLSGGNAILAYNSVLILALLLSGLGAYLLIRDVTGSESAAFLVGLAYAFCPYRWAHVVHLGPFCTQWLPFIILFFRRSVMRRSIADSAWLVLFIVLQILSSGYHAVVTGILLACLGAYYLRRMLRAGTWSSVAIAVALAGALVLPASIPYRIIQERHGIHRSRDMCIYWSATPGSFIFAGYHVGRFAVFPYVRWLHDWAVHHNQAREALYPGLPILLLAIVGLTSRKHRELAGLSLVIGVSAALLAFGPEIEIAGRAFSGPFDYVRHIPPVNMMRVPSRLGILSVLALDILAGLGWARLTMRFSARATTISMVGVALYLSLELFPVELHSWMRPIARPPSYTQYLASAPRGPVLELPYESSALFMLWSTAHWQPLVNGWGAYPAPLAENLGGEGHAFPRPAFTRRIQEAGVRYIVAHMNLLGPKRRKRILETPLPPGVRLVGVFEEARVYELGPVIDLDEKADDEDSVSH